MVEGKLCENLQRHAVCLGDFTLGFRGRTVLTSVTGH